jgi:hypothetical protein
LKAVRHELVHQGIEGLGRHVAGKEAYTYDFLNPHHIISSEPKAWQKAKDGLAGLNYAVHKPALVAEEMITHIAAGDWKRINLNEGEAKRVLKLMLRQGRRYYGKGFDLAFRHADPRVHRMMEGFTDLPGGPPDFAWRSLPGNGGP